MPSTKSVNPISQSSPNALKAFWLASRPKTWAASLCPVWIGASMAEEWDLKILGLTLLFSLLIQIGTNYANDYFDFVKGADTHLRNGPKRATLEGWIAPRTMWLAARFVFALSFCIALPLMLRAGLWSFFLAGLCIALGILYTGGPKPLGYLGLGELFVFLFFGPVAACGSYFLQAGDLTWPVFIASLAPGALSCSILIANNLRDHRSDALAQKKTLVVRFGRTFGSWEYALSIGLAALVPFFLVFGFHAPRSLLIASSILILAIPCFKKAFFFRDPLELLSLLPQSAFLLLVYTILFCLCMSIYTGSL